MGRQMGDAGDGQTGLTPNEKFRHRFRTALSIIDGAAVRIERRFGESEGIEDYIDAIRSQVAKMTNHIDEYAQNGLPPAPQEE